MKVFDHRIGKLNIPGWNLGQFCGISLNFGDNAKVISRLCIQFSGITITVETCILNSIIFLYQTVYIYYNYNFVPTEYSNNEKLGHVEEFTSI